jgi:hypothetical protein
VVLACGVLLLLIGVILIMTLPLPLPWRVLFALVWIADTCREICNMRTGAARVRRLRLNHLGQFVAEGPDGAQVPLQLLSGSVILQRIAWFRLRFPDQCRYAELMCGNPATDPAWQRLQLIWQQAGRTFGR